MVMRIAGLPVLGPSDLVGGARAVAGWTEHAAAVAADLPRRAACLLDGAEALLARVDGLADRVDGLLARVEGTVGVVDGVLTRAGDAVTDAGRLVGAVSTLTDRAAATVGTADEVARDAAQLVTGAGAVAARAGDVVDAAAAASDRARSLLDTWEPVSERAAPLARRFVEQLSEQEVAAAIRLVDRLPQLTRHLDEDILPILATLDRVGPDVHELLDVLKEVRQAILGIPGFAFFRRRGEERMDEQES